MMLHMKNGIIYGALVVGIAAVLGFGCNKAKYPSCDHDDQCNADGHKGVCVNHNCVQCRDDAACAPGQLCQAGACEAIPGYCDSSQPCPEGSECDASNRCHVKAAPAPATECDDSRPCGTGQQCQNGHCASNEVGECAQFAAPHFDFDSTTIRSDGRTVLETVAKCIASGQIQTPNILLTGHCDPRGEAEYNMTLGALRAQSVKAFLVGLGVTANVLHTSSRGKLDATGTTEESWAQDRRVDIELR